MTAISAAKPDSPRVEFVERWRKPKRGCFCECKFDPQGAAPTSSRIPPIEPLIGPSSIRLIGGTA